MSCRCKKPAECEECPEWIFTFADLVMLMMGFFVILWVLKPAPGKESKEVTQQDSFIDLAGEIRSAFGYVPDPTSSDPVDKSMLRRQRMGPRHGAESETPRDGAVGTDHLSTSIRPGKQASVGGRLLFAAGESKLTPLVLETLDQIADKIRGHYNIVMIKGHASLDDLPEPAGAPQRMELSLRRAQTVSDYLVTHGVQPEILRVQGCSTFEPVKQRNYAPDAQVENRRVEVEVTSTLLEERQDPGKPERVASAALNASVPARSPESSAAPD